MLSVFICVISTVLFLQRMLTILIMVMSNEKYCSSSFALDLSLGQWLLLEVGSSDTRGVWVTWSLLGKQRICSPSFHPSPQMLGQVSLITRQMDSQCVIHGYLSAPSEEHTASWAYAFVCRGDTCHHGARGWMRMWWENRSVCFCCAVGVSKRPGI